MNRRQYMLLSVFTLLAPPVRAGVDDWLKEKIKKGDRLDPKTVAAGLREALTQGTGKAVSTLGRENGFWSHPTLRIPMPPALQKAENALRRLGQEKLVDEFVLTLNRAAERATPAARDIFVGAIRNMSIKDATNILKGEDDAATQYFRRNTETPLTQAFLPVVTDSTRAVGVTARYKKMVKKIEPLGLVDPRKLDLDDYVTRSALGGLFNLVADEEKRIRKDPVARTSELLRKVFR